MRLVSLELSGFRGFTEKHSFDLDADAIVVVGPNGHGKTSMFDGILWGLSGRLPRLNNEDSRIVSMFSEDGHARVSLTFKDSTKDHHFTITRSFDGKESRVALETPQGSFQGPSAEGRLLDLIWPAAASASDPRDALATVLTRSVYLQQDLISHFVEAASHQERFNAVSELVGAGRVTELQASLERAKKSWTAITNQRQEELRPLRERLSVLESRLSELIASGNQALPIESDMWNSWLVSLTKVGLKSLSIEPASREAPAVIDNSIKILEGTRRSAERRLQTLRTVQTELTRLSQQPIPDTKHLNDSLTGLRKQRDELKHQLTEEQKRLADVRHQQAILQEKSEQLRALAAIALKHLEQNCPVCDQSYDRDATRSRLQGMMAQGKLPTDETASKPDKLPELLLSLTNKEKEVSLAEISLRTAMQTLQEHQSSQQTLTSRLNELDITAADGPTRSSLVAEAITATESSIRQIAEIQRIGESLSLRLAQSSAAAAIDELRRETETLHREKAVRENEVIARNKTGEKAQRVIEALREASSAVVEQRLREIGPLLQSIYARIDPHPAFRSVMFLSQIIRGKGQLATVISDPIAEKECDSPSDVLSSSQVKALAVSVFLALNIALPEPPLSIAILDDPLQSLDDINLLGLVDLLRRSKNQRQLFVSTHDPRIGNLLSRKLRPTNQAGRTIVIEFEGWSRKGPVVFKSEIKSDPFPLRLAAS